MSLMPIYLDYAATTPMEPLVREAMLPWLQRDHVGNPSSSHAFGLHARQAIDQARDQIGALVGAPPESIFLTSGATESDNLALFGVMRRYAQQGGHLITTEIEHSAVLEAAKALAREGFEVTFIPPQANGQIRVEAIEQAIQPNTRLISVQHVNNETGMIQPCMQIGELAYARHILFHVDAAQSVGKLPLSISQLNADFLSISAHKLYGPQGIGALVINPRTQCRLQPFLFGGEQQQGLRPGTLPVHQIVGFGVACAVLKERLQFDHQHAVQLAELFWQTIATISGIQRNGVAEAGVPGIINFSLKDVHGEALLQRLSEAVALSSGSACHADQIAPSHVLLAMGLAPYHALNSWRVSFGRFTTVSEIEQAAQAIHQAVTALRALSPRSGVDSAQNSWKEGITFYE